MLVLLLWLLLSLDILILLTHQTISVKETWPSPFLQFRHRHRHCHCRKRTRTTTLAAAGVAVAQGVPCFSAWSCSQRGGTAVVDVVVGVAPVTDLYRDRHRELLEQLPPTARLTPNYQSWLGRRRPTRCPTFPTIIDGWGATSN